MVGLKKRKNDENLVLTVEILSIYVQRDFKYDEIFLISENYILSDPQLKDPIPLEYLSHADRYVAELRKACHLMTKLRNSSSSQP